MLQLPNNCRIGKMSVIPDNWESPKAGINSDWLIHYRFYDDNLDQNKLIRIKGGINRLKTVRERREAIRDLLQMELEKIRDLGFNPITGHYSKKKCDDISSSTAFDEVLNYALKKITVEKNTKCVITSSLNVFLAGARRLNYHRLSVRDITKKHIHLILENCGEFKKLEGTAWSPRYYNAIRKDIGILYRPLLKIEIVAHNVPYAVEPMKSGKKIRITTTKKQREAIMKILCEPRNYTFKRFLEMFRPSGARFMELVNVKKEDVYLEDLRFLITCKKGSIGHRQEWRIINKHFLHYWEEIYNEAKAGQYLFGKNFKPGDKHILPEQVNRRWRKNIKEKLGIPADAYSLKHTYLDQISERHTIKVAQKAAGHTSAKTTAIYTVGEDERKNKLLKNIKTTFV